MASLFCFIVCIWQVNARNYVYDSAARTWDNARQFCQTYDGLATIITATDIQTAKSKAGGMSWIGLVKNGAWQWDDGTACTWTTGHDCSDFWEGPEPNGDGTCVEFVIHTSQFNDKPCTATLGTLCNTQTTSPTTHNPTTDKPTTQPTYIPTHIPTYIPSTFPTNIPSTFPTYNPTTNRPTMTPSTSPTKSPNAPSKGLDVITPTISPQVNAGRVAETTENETDGSSKEEKKSSDASFDYMLLIYVGGVACLLCICLIIAIVWYKKRNKYSRNTENMKNINNNTCTSSTELQSVSGSVSNKLDEDIDADFILNSAPQINTIAIDKELKEQEIDEFEQVDGLYTVPINKETDNGTTKDICTTHINNKTTVTEHKRNETDDGAMDDLYSTHAKIVTTGK